MAFLPNPYEAFKSTADAVSSWWGSGSSGDTRASSLDQFYSIDALNKALNGGQNNPFPGFGGPSIPSGNVPYTTQSIPGAIFDSGLPATIGSGVSGSWEPGVFAGAAARNTTDLSATAYRPSNAVPLPIADQVKAWWDKATGSLSMPKLGLDGPKPAAAPAPMDIKTIAVMSALGLFATVALARVMKK